MSWFDWYQAADPVVAHAHFEARAVAKTPQAYAYASVLVRGYARARERGVRKSRNRLSLWPSASVPADIKAPFAALVQGFDHIVAQYAAPPLPDRVRTAVTVIHTTDIINAIGYDPDASTAFSELYLRMSAASFCLADFDALPDPAALEEPGSPPALCLHPLRVTAFAALRQWLLDVGHPDAAHETLASLVTFQYSGDRMAARIAAMSGWLLATTAEERHRWSVAQQFISADTSARKRGALSSLQ
jgi:hypothetical protein